MDEKARLMELRFEPLEDDHLPDAAGLVAERYTALRATVPEMPSLYENPGAFLPMLRWIAGHFEGVAALHEGRLVGFVAGMALDDFRGKRAAYSPEWANGVTGEWTDGVRRTGPVYRAMYAHISEQWVDKGCGLHLVSMMAHDRQGIEAWHWSGFGLAAADAIRSLEPIGRSSSAFVGIRRARAVDLDTAWDLEQILHRHLASAPTFLHDDGEDGKVELRDWLEQEANSLWLAEKESGPVAFMMAGPANENACTIIRDHATCSITGALTLEEVRGRGVGAKLLEEVLAWARASGYERCAVDFEPENVEGSRFWMRHFQPVCLTLARRVDERILK